MIPTPQDHYRGPARLESPSGVSTHQTSRPASGDTSSYHPSSAFRRLLNQSVDDRKSEGAASRKSSPQRALVRRSPKLLTFLGASILFGIASGFLELAVLEIQVHVRQRVDWHNLMASRHISWMVPATAPLVIIPFTAILVWPALALFAWRSPIWKTTGTLGGGLGLELVGIGPGHALLYRTASRSSRFPSDRCGHFGGGSRFSILARDVSRHNRLALPLLFVRGNRDPGTDNLPGSSMERHGPRAGSCRAPAPWATLPICSGSWWTLYERIG